MPSSPGDQPLPFNVEQLSSSTVAASQYANSEGKQPVTDIDTTLDETKDLYWKAMRKFLLDELRKAELECQRRKFGEDDDENDNEKDILLDVKFNAVTKRPHHGPWITNRTTFDNDDDPSDPRKPYSACPLPTWLQKALRSPVCGVYVPSKLPAGMDPPQVTRESTHTGRCVLCNGPQRSRSRLRSHFVACVRKYGNPQGANHYDARSIIDYYHQELDGK